MRRRSAANGVRLKGLAATGHWPSGNVRWYLRRKGQKALPMPDLPKDAPAFIVAWAAATGLATPPEKPVAGTIGGLVVAFMASAQYQNLAPKTRAAMGASLRDIRKVLGKALAKDLMPRHIQADLRPRSPNPANARLKAWRAMCKWGFQTAGLLDDDPAKPVAKRAVPKTDGHLPWTRADVAAFRAHWPVTSRQRLAFELIHRTGAAIGDAVRLGPGMVRRGWLTYQRGKTASHCACPMTATTAPPWFEHDDWLAECLQAQPGHMIWMTTASGAPRSVKAASQWFAAAARAAGVPKSAHGLRKHRAAVWKENGATSDQRMALLGHESEVMADHYSKSAALPRIIWGTEKLQLDGPDVQLLPQDVVSQ